jgi:hypothetical protein
VVSLATGEVDELLDLSDREGGINLNDWSPDGRWIGFSHGQGTWEYWMANDPLKGWGGL